MLALKRSTEHLSSPELRCLAQNLRKARLFLNMSLNKVIYFLCFITQVLLLSSFPGGYVLFTGYTLASALSGNPATTSLLSMNKKLITFS